MFRMASMMRTGSETVLTRSGSDVNLCRSSAVNRSGSLSESAAGSSNSLNRTKSEMSRLYYNSVVSFLSIYVTAEMDI